MAAAMEDDQQLLHHQGACLMEDHFLEMAQQGMILEEVPEGIIIRDHARDMAWGYWHGGGICGISGVDSNPFPPPMVEPPAPAWWTKLCSFFRYRRSSDDC